MPRPPVRRPRPTATLAAMPHLVANNLSLYYEQAGAGWPLVLLHGLGLDCRMWDAHWQPLAARYQVTRYDVRGHGRSAAPATGYSRDARVNELRALLRGLGIARCHLVGLSMGATIALGFALRHPALVSGLVLADFLVAGARLPLPIPRQDLAHILRAEGADAARHAWLAEPLFAPALANPAAAPLLRTMVQEHSCALWRDPSRPPRT